MFANGPGDQGSIPGQIISKIQKWHLMPPCLTLNIIWYRSRVKWRNLEKRVVPSPIPRCSSYWKGSLWVTLDYRHQLYIYGSTCDIMVIIIGNGHGDPSSNSGHGDPSSNSGQGYLYFHIVILLMLFESSVKYSCFGFFRMSKLIIVFLSGLRLYVSSIRSDLYISRGFIRKSFINVCYGVWDFASTV